MSFFVETGGRKDQIEGTFDWGPNAWGYRNVGYDLTSTWDDYGMPEPTCNDRGGTGVNAHVYSGDKCGQTNREGRRWGKCDAWRSSCGQKFLKYMDWAAGLTDTVKAAATAAPGNQAHVSPCVFGDLWTDAMAAISKYVGSVDPTTGYSFPPKGQPGYVPRAASWIFGGDAAHSNYPNYNNPWKGAKSWWYLGDPPHYEAYNMDWRLQVSNGEFCRSVMDKTYPCHGGGNYPDWCGGCKDKGYLGYCYDYHCSHPPLAYFDKKAAELRNELLDALLIYEGKNKATLGGKTVDEACKEKVAKAVGVAPEILPVHIDETQSEYTATIQAETDALAEQAALEKALAAQEDAEAEGISTWALGAGALAFVGAIYFIRRRMKG